MKKMFIAILYFTFIGRLFGQTTFAEPSIDLLRYIGGYLENNLEYDLGYTPDMLDMPNIEIWGWSSDGSVAYTIESFAGYRGGTIIEAVIFDFKEDHIGWSRQIDSYDYRDERSYNVALDSFLESFVYNCEFRRIEFVRSNYNSLPIIHNGSRININVDTVKRNDWTFLSDDFGVKFENYTVIAEANGKRKIIKTENKPYSFAIVPCGYFLSPFEDRALIVLASFGWGWEGDCDVNFIFTGCHLTSGFN